MPEAAIGSPAHLNFRHQLILEQFGREHASNERAAATAAWQRLRRVRHPRGRRVSDLAGRLRRPVESMDRSRPIHLFGMLLNFRGELDAALVKTSQAFALARSPNQKTRILIVRAEVLKRKLKYREALDTLAKARQFASGTEEPRLHWAIEFNEVAYLLEAGGANDVASRLGALEAGARRLGRSLDLVRLRWLAARVASSQGRWTEASSLLAEIWKAMADRRLWFDAALAVLELAEVELERGMAREVKGLATASANVFRAQTLPTELFASIQLFWDAVRQEAATSQEARQLVQRMRRSGGRDAEAA